MNVLSVDCPFYRKPAQFWDQFIQRVSYEDASGCLNMCSCVLLEEVRTHDDNFRLKKNAIGKLGFSLPRNALLLFGCLHMDFMLISLMSILAMYRFWEAMVFVFGPVYLRQPNATNTFRIMGIVNGRGFLEMLGASIALQGQLKGLLASECSYLNSSHHMNSRFGPHFWHDMIPQWYQRVSTLSDVLKPFGRQCTLIW